MGHLQEKQELLINTVRSYGSCAVAFSGGVDSAVACKAAVLALADKAIAVTGSSASLAEGELDTARSVAAQIGIRHVVIQTDEFENPDYVRNAGDRCFHCKTELYGQMQSALDSHGIATIVNGANVDDLDDYRPGMQAAANYAVKTPLADCGLNKADVRSLAKHWKLPVWDKPAAPCLSSRIAYGQEVTPERLKMVDQAERFLRELGFASVRVRYHDGDLARVEVSPQELSRLAEPTTRTQLTQRLRELGFRFITLDLEGFRSGNLNQLVTLGSLDASPKSALKRD